MGKVINVLNWLFVAVVSSSLIYFGIQGKKYLDNLPPEDDGHD
jgi:hypothetical protein